MRTPSIRGLFLLTAAACLLLQGRAQAEFPGTDDKWLHIKSANFELYSRNREADSRELLHNLELLRASFLETYKLAERRRLEVTVYFFKSEKDFRYYVSEAYGSKHAFVGFYQAGVDRAVIYLFPGEDASITRQLIFHEYIHHLLRVAEQNPPPWLNEGMAELFSTVAVTSSKLEFGQPSRGRLWQLNFEDLMPVEKLFAVEQTSPIFQQGDHTGLFYAESWALLHYLYFGDSKIPAERKIAFLSLVLANRFANADEMRHAFQATFGVDYAEMQRRLEKYLTSGKYFSVKKPLPNIPAAASYALRAVAQSEIRLRLAELALRVNRMPLAKLVLLTDAQQNPSDTRSLEVLGADALRDDDQLVAGERWAKAIEAGTLNPAIYRELGLMEGRALFSRFDPYYRVPQETAERLRRYLIKAIEYNPEQTDAYEMLAWVEAFAGEPVIKNVALIQKRYPDLTRKQRTALALAFVRVRFNQSAEALEMLAALETMDPDPWETYGIEATRAFIEKRPIKRENLRPANTTEAGRVRLGPPKISQPPQDGNR